MGVCTVTHLGRSEGNFAESVLPTFVWILGIKLSCQAYIARWQVSLPVLTYRFLIGICYFVYFFIHQFFVVVIVVFVCFGVLGMGSLFVALAAFKLGEVLLPLP